MGFSLKQALVLSSKSQAYTYILKPDNRIVKIKAYKLIVSYIGMDGIEKGVATFKIHRVIYSQKSPDSKSIPIIAENPHKTIQKETPDEIIAYIQEELGFPVEQGWHPVEDGDDE